MTLGLSPTSVWCGPSLAHVSMKNRKGQPSLHSVLQQLFIMPPSCLALPVPWHPRPSILPGRILHLLSLRNPLTCHHVMRWEMQVPWEPVGVGTWPQRLLLSSVFAESSRCRNGQSSEQKGRSCPGRVTARLWRVQGGRLGHRNIGVKGAPCLVSLVCGLAGLCDLSWQGRWHLVPWAPGRWTPWGVHVSALGPALRDRFQGL